MKNSDFQLQVIRRLTAMEKDLKHHIKRTDLLEAMIKPLVKLYHWGQVTLLMCAAGGGVAGLMKVYETFKHW